MLKENVLLNCPTLFSSNVHYKHVVTCTDQLKFALCNLYIYLLYCVDSWNNIASFFRTFHTVKWSLLSLHD